jgi:hypothetical protein
MSWVDRQSIEIAAGNCAAFLQALLVPVVAWLAQGLAILWIPEQSHVATMRHDVIDYGCGD